jgi:hypothetical protein
MSRWTDEELRELITLWPTNSTSQIAKRLHRQRSAIRSKAKRLQLEGLLPHNPPEHVDVNPRKRRPPQSKIMPPKPPLAPDWRTDECAARSDGIGKARPPQEKRG